MDNKKREWFDDSSVLTSVIICLILTIIILSQAFAVRNNIGAVNTFRNLLNHNTIYIIALIYFIFLKTKIGRKYFNILNSIYIVIYFLIVLASFLTIFQSFGLVSLVELLVNFILLLYMMYTFLNNTRLWKDFRLDKVPFDEIKNEWYFYSISFLSVMAMLVDLMSAVKIDGVMLSFFDSVYTVLFARYIYLYKKYEESKEKEKISDDLFVLIDKEKKDIPLFNKQIKDVKKYKYNFYQKVAILTMIVGFFGGIIIGNLFPACSYVGLYNEVCSVTRFNTFLTIGVWFVSFLVSLFIFFLGHVIRILSDIDEKLKKIV